MESNQRECDHPNYEVVKETLFGMRNVDYVCTSCGRAFGSIQELHDDGRLKFMERRW